MAVSSEITADEGERQIAVREEGRKEAELTRAMLCRL